MINKLIFKKNIIIFLSLIIFILIINAPIFEIKKALSNEINELGSYSICVLHYNYTTGPGWQVIYENNTQLQNEDIVLYTFFDPRLLKDNQDFELDYMAQYLVKIKEVKSIELKGEEIKVIYPEEIIIVYDTDKKYYKLLDLSLSGFFKSLLSIFVSDYRYSS